MNHSQPGLFRLLLFFVFFFFVEINSQPSISLLWTKNQSTVAQSAETTVGKQSLMSCTKAHFTGRCSFCAFIRALRFTPLLAQSWLTWVAWGLCVWELWVSCHAGTPPHARTAAASSWRGPLCIWVVALTHVTLKAKGVRCLRFIVEEATDRQTEGQAGRQTNTDSMSSRKCTNVHTRKQKTEQKNW